jgi:methionyl aminopeptidase
MHKIHIKSLEEIEIMREGGKKLAHVRNKLEEKVAEGVSAMEIEELAVDLIKKSGAESSFKKVPGYKWATCININEGVVHGIPKKETIFKKGDIVSVDVGLYYKGFHTDTSTSKLIGEDKGKQKFLEVGKSALKAGIRQAIVGNHIVDISEAIESVLKGAALTPIEALTGHGVGRELHEEPYIPCFVRGSRGKSIEISKGMVLAIEVMYTEGNSDIMIDSDGWTIRTKDGKISALFEETVAVTNDGPFVLTNE